jgi:hypothetical protein
VETPYGLSADVDLPYDKALEPVAEEASARLQRVLAAVAS